MHPHARSPLGTVPVVRLVPSLRTVLPVVPASRLFQPNLYVAAAHRLQPERLARGKRQPRYLLARIEGPGRRHASTIERAGHNTQKDGPCVLPCVVLRCDPQQREEHLGWQKVGLVRAANEGQWHTGLLPLLGPGHTTFATSASTRCADGGASAGTGAPLAAKPVEPAALRTSDNLTAPPAMHLATKEPSWGSEARRDGSGAAPGGSKGEARLAGAPGSSGRTGGASSSPRGERGMPCRGGRVRGSSMRGMPRE